MNRSRMLSCDMLTSVRLACSPRTFVRTASIALIGHQRHFVLLEKPECIELLVLLFADFDGKHHVLSIGKTQKDTENIAEIAGPHPIRQGDINADSFERS